jgi:hypothetical protein
MWRRDTSFGTALATARAPAEALLNRDASNVKISLCAITDRVMGVITHARPLTFGTYPSDSLQPGLGPVDPTSHSASHSAHDSGPGPLDAMVRVLHGSWRDDPACPVQLDVHRSEFGDLPVCLMDCLD